MITIKPMETNKEKCKEDCNCKIEGKTHSMNDGCGCPAHNYVDKQQFEPQDKEQLKKELIGLVRENVKIIEKYTNHFEPQVDKQQEISPLAIETAERIVIDYANFSGREDTLRTLLRKSAIKHISQAIEQERKRIIDKINSVGGIGGLQHLFDIINDKHN